MNTRRSDRSPGPRAAAGTIDAVNRAIRYVFVPRGGGSGPAAPSADVRAGVGRWVLITRAGRERRISRGTTGSLTKPLGHTLHMKISPVFITCKCAPALRAARRERNNDESFGRP
ncbi:hypothetical protein EVAR_66317_1 [Eumeta japonica]|uniref:Uncharacterized protein n=1 Tax=Eumeta variegata TaxID=151549 RepID=A0A4C1ZUL9_EUMVA|nr:hypothetical protein EVAR_66317_1 [Eumeta japonica]